MSRGTAMLASEGTVERAEMELPFEDVDDLVLGVEVRGARIAVRKHRPVVDEQRDATRRARAI